MGKSKKKSNPPTPQQGSAADFKVIDEESLLLNEEKRRRRNEDKNYNRSTLRLAGELVALISLAFLIFTIFLILRFEGVEWMQNYWLLCTPLWIILFFLLCLTQSRRLTSRAPLTVRLSWLICVVSIIAFLILLGLRLEEKKKFIVWSYEWIFLPLWILAGTLLMLGIVTLFIGCRIPSDQSSRRQRHILAGIIILFFVIVFTPFTLLLQLNLSFPNDDRFSWGLIFIPLWITDAFFFCISCMLCLFSCGSSEGVFNLSQIIIFTLSLIPASLFKVLVFLRLDNRIHMSVWKLFIPLELLLIMIIAFGLNVWYSQRPKTRK